jgi:hypothetical protein
MLQVLSSAKASSMSETWVMARQVEARSCVCRSRYAGGVNHARIKACEDEKCGDKLLFISTTRRVNVKVEGGAVGDII